MSRAQQLRNLCGGWSESRLTARAIDIARMGIVDVVGCIVAGASTPAAAAVRELAMSQGSVAESSLPGTRVRLAAPLAALCNGVAGHVLDYDDMSFTLVGHPSVVLAPTLLALGEARNAGGREVISAYVLGFEVDMWFARAMVPAHYEAGWHSTSSIGIFGAAAAAAQLLRLDADAHVTALAIAASQAAGLRANFGSMTKSLHAGQAAEAGVRAALLAAAGFTANAQVFDAPGGFFDLYRTNASVRPAAPTLELEAGGLGIKAAACCGAGVTVVEAAREAHAALGSRAIAAVDLAVNPTSAAIMPYADAPDGLRAKYCIAYCAAVGLLDGAGGLAQFSDERARSPDVQALMKRVRVRVDPRLRGDSGHFGVEIVVTPEDGPPIRASRELAPGHPESPLPTARLEAKFLECTAAVVGEARARESLAALSRLESLPGLAAALAPLGHPLA
jgi:2-methylcitrate dehydratase PrpD